MKELKQYIKENTVDTEINEGFFGNLMLKLGNFLVKKFKVSENTGKELNEKLNKETEAINAEIKKVSKGKIDSIEKWWQAYTIENKAAAKVKSPAFYSQSILKNTGNVTLTMKKMLDSYGGIGILENTIICMFIQATCNQYAAIVEAIVKDNEKKKNLINQLLNLKKLIEGIKTGENKDAEKHIKDAAKDLGKNAEKLAAKFK